jgi:hypothetical protein
MNRLPVPGEPVIRKAREFLAQVDDELTKPFPRRRRGFHYLLSSKNCEVLLCELRVLG